ncbi:MAG: hypothetical protein ACTSRU_10825 [Candidatus Hodarchaeales archaeon]
MKQYRVKKSFTDSEGEYKQGETVSLSDDRASKLITLGKVAPKKELPKKSICAVPGVDVITTALEEAASVLEDKNAELAAVKKAGVETALTLQKTLDKSTSAHSELVDSLREARNLIEFQALVKSLDDSFPVINLEPIDG